MFRKNSWISKLFAKLAGTRTPIRNRPTGFKPTVESLEDRSLMDASNVYSNLLPPVTPPPSQTASPQASPGDLYATYQSEVALANQVYSNAIQPATSARDLAIANSQTSAQAVADQLYVAYTTAVSTAQANYQSAHDSLVAVYMAAGSQAYELAGARVNAALDAYQSAVASAKNDFNNASQASADQYAIAKQSAEGQYATTMLLSQSALDNAQQVALANPDDPAALAALAQAQQDYATTALQAGAARDSAIASAQAVKQSADDAAAQIFEVAFSAAVSAAQPEIDAAQQQMQKAEQFAFDAMQTAENAAVQTNLQAQADVWSAYLTSIDTVNSQEQANEGSIQTLFTASEGSALTVWQNSEAADWAEYTNNLAAEQGAPAPEARVLEPSSTTFVLAPVQGQNAFLVQTQTPQPFIPPPAITSVRVGTPGQNILHGGGWYRWTPVTVDGTQGYILDLWVPDLNQWVAIAPPNFVPSITPPGAVRPGTINTPGWSWGWSATFNRFEAIPPAGWTGRPPLPAAPTPQQPPVVIPPGLTNPSPLPFDPFRQQPCPPIPYSPPIGPYPGIPGTPGYMPPGPYSRPILGW